MGINVRKIRNSQNPEILTPAKTYFQHVLYAYKKITEDGKCYSLGSPLGVKLVIIRSGAISLS